MSSAGSKPGSGPQCLKTDSTMLLSVMSIRIDLTYWTRSQFASNSWLQMTGGENILALLPRPLFFNLLCVTARLTLLDNTTVLSSFYLYQFYTLIYIYQFITSILMSFSFAFTHQSVSGNVRIISHRPTRD